MTDWRNYHIYYTDLDRLILECVYAVLRRNDDRLETCFWERHHAGGPHLRVRLRGTTESLAAAGDDLYETVTRYLSSCPSSALSGYSKPTAMRLLEVEGESSESTDVEYRVNAIVERPYSRLSSQAISEEARTLLESFLHDCMPFAVTLLRCNQSKLEQMLRLYFLQAMFVTGSLPEGCVSYKSHWEGFSALQAPPQLSEKIRHSYREQMDRIRLLMLEVKDRYESQTLANDPVLSCWSVLLTSYSSRVREFFEAGGQIDAEFTSQEAVRRSLQQLPHDRVEDNPFLSAFYADERFLVSIQKDRGMLRPRVLTNLLYSLLTVIGLKVVDKMTLCYYAHKAVEDYFQKDLTDILKRTIDKVVGLTPPSLA